MRTRFFHSTLSVAIFAAFATPVLADTSIQSAEADTELGEIVVTASGFAQKAKEAAASITVISSKDLETKAYRDVTDALKDVPGVVVTGGGSSSDISIRGMGSAYTMMLIDGKRVNSRGVRPNSDNAGIEQGWMPPITAIQRIEVIRGPASALYGSDAMGGVVNIITKKTADAWMGSIKTDATIQANSEGGNTYQTGVFVSGPLIQDVLGVRGTANYSHREEDKIIGGYKEQTMRNGNLVLSLTPNDQNTIEFEVLRSLQNRNATVGKTIDPTPTVSKGKLTYPTDSLTDYDRTQYSLTHQGYFENFTTQTYLQREENDNPSRNMFETNTILNTQNQFKFGNHALNVGGRWQREQLDDAGNQLSINGTTLNQLERDSWAIFAEDEWRIVPQFALTGSLRYDQDENYGSNVTPKLYGVWQPNDQWIVKGGISKGYKTPALRAATDGWGQTTGGGRSKGMIIGNSNLKPEKSTNVELSFNWDNNDNLAAGVTVFNTDFKDKITEVRSCVGDDVPGTLTCQWKGESFDFISQRENVDEAQMRGVEATFDWKITPTLDLAANYTYTDTEQKSGAFKGKPLNQMPKHMFNTTLNWQAHEKLSTWGRLNYRSRTSEYLSRTSMADSTPAYTFVDMGVVYKPKAEVNLTAGVYNVFDKKVDNADYGTTLDGRRFNVGFQYTF